MVRRTRLSANTSFVSRATGASLHVRTTPTPEFGGRLRGPLVFLRTFPAAETRIPPHRHMQFSETFEVKAGFADMWIEGEGDVFLRPHDVRVVAKAVAHTHPRRHGSETLEVLQTIDPATEAALGYVNTLGHLMLDGRDREGELPALAALAVFDELDGRTYLSRLPVWPQRRLLLPLAGKVARRRRYHVYPAQLD